MTEHSRSPRQPRKPGGRAGGPPGSKSGGKPGGKGAGRPVAGKNAKAAGRGSGAKNGPRFAGTTRPSQPTKLPERRATPEVDVHDPDGVRLQKLLAAAGVGSRRVCENLIAAGRVQVDGQVVTELGVRIDARAQTVHVDGVRINLDEDRVYLAFNKPKGVVTTMHDELGRISLEDYVGNREERLFHVGRLDADTEGLLLLTNDGDLAHRLQHPSYGVLKTYVATIRGPVAGDVGRRLREGVELDDGPVKVDSFRIVDHQPGKAMVEVVLHEGRKHVVRRMLDAVGHPVVELVRTEVGPIRLADLKVGRLRRLNKAEIGALYKAAGL
ncbi:pseudouridine synthase [Terracoccus luteus]|uniref:Pseudouridine synthase n=1 Tax=Terracoccus luteus TaxID=53356 RepID=A0A839Q1M1_9MICO|nr:pseudouridine synthase [Terracoccus luteus]MBB2988205.1 23S rRNA pseudouridine2605 synthase [Terracoccus luteus]MCP2173840.1 23S rRNA pseudouridine2605 synthase [Terracoccus luteus]